MCAALHHVESDCLKPIYDNTISKEETLELVIPDYCADVGTILDVRGQFLLSSQKAKQNELQISATLEATLVYGAEDTGEIQYHMVTIPFELTVPVPGADENAKVVSRYELCGLDARLLNPRKLLFRANVSAQLRVFVQGQFMLWDNLSEGCTLPVHILRKKLEHSLILGVREKSFMISDEYRLPPGREQNAKMLSAATEICVQDVKSVGNKVVVKALAQTRAVFLTEEGGNLFSCLFATQFSQIVEVDTYGESMTNSVSILLRNAEFTVSSEKEEGFLCAATLQLLAQVVTADTKTACYIADAYSNCYPLEIETTDMKLERLLPECSLMLNLRGGLQTKLTPSELMYVELNEICTAVEGNKLLVTLELGGAGRAEGGELIALSAKLTAEECITLAPNQSLRICAICCERPAIVGAPQSAEICVDLELTYRITEHMEISPISALELNNEDEAKRPESRPTLVIICAPREADVWSLAKQYGSTVEMIEKANTVEGEFQVNNRPLLIPRAKT